MKNKREIKILITFVFIIISVFIFIQAFPITNETVYHYNIFQNTDYKVYLTKNDFFEQEYLEKNNLYLKDLTRYIEFDFLYNYNASAKENLNCKYDIVSKLYLEYSNTKQVIFEKNYPIIENKTIQKNDSNKIDIEEKINIDYQKYNSEVESFKEKFNLPLTAYMIINFNVETWLQNQENIKQTSTSKATIDLSQPAYEIKVKESDEQENTILETQDLNKNINYIALAIGLILFVISSGIFGYQILKYQVTELNKIKIKVMKILRKYKEIIVEVESMPNINGKNIIDVKGFEELITIEEKIRLPILFYEENENEYVFLIIDENVVYRKIMK